MKATFPVEFAPLLMLVGFGVALVTVIVHVYFALAVFQDAKRLKPVFVVGGVWALATLAGGVFVAAIYWVMHHSDLVRRE